MAINRAGDRTNLLDNSSHKLITVGTSLSSVKETSEYTTTEPTKTAAQTSFKYVLLRSLVHVLPIFGTLDILALSFFNLYWKDLGAPNQSAHLQLWQLGAKVHEIFLSASLSTIVLHRIQYDLMSEGMPLGFLAAGYQLSSIGYLTTAQFRGALLVTGKAGRSFKWLRLGLSLAFSIFLSTVSGPSSVVVMLPRLGLWKVPRSIFNVTDHEIPFYVMDRNYSQLWPNEVKGDVLDPVCFSYDTAEISPYCPSSSFDIVNAWVSAFQNEWLAPNISVQIQNTAANQGDAMIRYLASESDNIYPGHTESSTIMARDAKNLGDYYTAFETWSLEGASRTINQPIFKPYLNEILIFQKPVVESEFAVIFSDQYVAEVEFPHTSLSSPPFYPDDNQHWMVPLNFTASNFDFSHGNIPHSIKRYLARTLVTHSSSNGLT